LLSDLRPYLSPSASNQDIKKIPYKYKPLLKALCFSNCVDIHKLSRKQKTFALETDCL
jgi:hypothetical protein